MSQVWLIGDPVAHSLSPAMHNAAFAALGLPHRRARGPPGPLSGGRPAPRARHRLAEPARPRRGRHRGERDAARTAERGPAARTYAATGDRRPRPDRRPDAARQARQGHRECDGGGRPQHVASSGGPLVSAVDRARAAGRRHARRAAAAGMRLLTAGESHGPLVLAVLGGVPAGLEISASEIDVDLRRRQLGYGRGARQRIERDAVRITGGVRQGRTTGAPVALEIANKDAVNWERVMSAAPVVEPPDAVTRLRPGHADLAGA